MSATDFAKSVARYQRIYDLECPDDYERKPTRDEIQKESDRRKTEADQVSDGFQAMLSLAQMCWVFDAEEIRMIEKLQNSYIAESNKKAFDAWLNCEDGSF